MDPLSATASVIACLQAANSVISVCLDYRAALKEAPWGLARAFDDVRDLRNVLETLENLGAGASSQNLEVDSDGKRQRASLLLLCSDNGPLQNCAVELNRLEKKLCAPKWTQNLGKKRKALIQAVGWQIKDSDVKESLSVIGRYKATITLALTADEVALLEDIQSLSLSMQTNLSTMQEDLSTLMQDQQATKLDGRHKAILNWLSPASPDASQLATLAAGQEGNSDWILQSEEFTEWRSNAAHPMLWLSGIPGAGKTTLLTKVLHHFQLKLDDQAQNERLAFFFCDFPLHPNWMVPARTGKFLQSINSAGKDIKPALSMLADALVSIAKHSSILLLIDALDECHNSGEITNVLSSIKQEGGIKIFVTSRDLPHINNSLGDCIRIRLEARGDEVSDDIRNYIQTRLDTEAKLKWLSPSFKMNIQQTLLFKSGGMFRWVQCQIDQISQLRTIRAIRKALNDLPDGLDDTYERILLGVPRHHIDVVRRILQWLSFATASMTLLELHDAVAIDPELDFLDEESQLSSPQDIFDLCSSLTTVTSVSTIQLAHASVKEYLLSDKIKNSTAAEFALSPKESMIDIARYCLAYLSFKDFEIGPSISYDAFEARLARYPLLNHAAVAWPYQLLAAGEPPELNGEIMRFLTANHNTFMSWIQVLNALPVIGKNPVTAWCSYPKLATPLYYAASFGLSQIVRTLIESGEDLNAPASRFGGTALHGAVVRHHIPIIKLLLAAGADVNKQDSNSISPLNSAMWHEENEIVSLLLEYGAVQADMPSAWFETQAYDRFANARGIGRKQQDMETALPGNENIQRYLEKGDDIKSFDIFA